MRAHLFFAVVKVIRARQRVINPGSTTNRSKRANQPPDKIRKDFAIESASIDGYVIHTLSQNKSAESPHLIFLHGGAYIMQASSLHWQFIRDLAKTSGHTVSFVQYPLAPESNHHDAINHVLKVTEYVKNQYSRRSLQIAGDSAGAGLAIASIQALIAGEFEQPYTKLALISPWLNVTSLNRVSAELMQKDIVLDRDQLLWAARAYADGSDLNHPHLSPMLGDFKGFPETGLWMGGCDLFDIDVDPFLERLEQSDIPYTAYRSQNMIHDYPIMPIPEGKEALNQIATFLQSNR